MPRRESIRSMVITIRKFGVTYTEEDKCPACSNEVDKGGRLKAKRRTRWFLKCDRCRYSVLSEKTVLQRETRTQKHHDKLFRERL